MLKELLIENTPKYTQILPFSQTRVTYRPFVVREEKSLMISKETAGFEDLMMTIRNVINNCTTNLPNDDCKNLPFCDLEYLFIKIREKSVGESVVCNITCPITKEVVQTTMDLQKVKITSKKPESKLKIDTNISVVLQQPTMQTYLTLNKYEVKQEEDGVLELLALCISEIHANEEVYYTKDLPHTEVLQFVESLTAKQFSILLNFIKNIPTIEVSIDYVTSDKVKRSIILRGFTDFLELFLVMHL